MVDPQLNRLWVVRELDPAFTSVRRERGETIQSAGELRHIGHAREYLFHECAIENDPVDAQIGLDLGNDHLPVVEQSQPLEDILFMKGDRDG